MLQKIRNKKGILVIEAILLAAVFLPISGGVAQTAQNGTLKKNGQKIWCKMLNNGNDVCDDRYGN